jgi:hypothetical protein
MDDVTDSSFCSIKARSPRQHRLSFHHFNHWFKRLRLIHVDLLFLCQQRSPAKNNGNPNKINTAWCNCQGTNRDNKINREDTEKQKRTKENREAHKVKKKASPKYHLKQKWMDWCNKSQPETNIPTQETIVIQDKNAKKNAQQFKFIERKANRNKLRTEHNKRKTRSYRTETRQQTTKGRSTIQEIRTNSGKRDKREGQAKPCPLPVSTMSRSYAQQTARTSK